MSSEKIHLSLSRSEALVLFEWLVRTDDAELIPHEDESEIRVLWKLEGQLEGMLIEPYRPDYHELLMAARREVLGE